MSRATECDPASENLGPVKVRKLFDFPASAALSTQSSGPGLASILFAEHDSVQRGLSVEILTHSGYAVTPVQDGLQAWEALHASRYDLLITDNNMPRMTGLELAERTRLEGMKLPIIVASGAVGLPAGTDYDWLRVAARLQKPFATDELLKTVEQVLCAAGCLRQRRDNIFPMLLQRFSHITPYHHWGLNE